MAFKMLLFLACLIGGAAAAGHLGSELACGRGTVEANGECVAQTPQVSSSMDGTVEMRVAGARLTLAAEDCETCPVCNATDSDEDEEELPEIVCAGPVIAGVTTAHLKASGGQSATVFLRGDPAVAGSDIYMCEFTYDNAKMDGYTVMGVVSASPGGQTFEVACPTEVLKPTNIHSLMFSAEVDVFEAGVKLCKSAEATSQTVKFATEGPAALSDQPGEYLYQASSTKGGDEKYEFMITVEDNDSEAEDVKVSARSSDETKLPKSDIKVERTDNSEGVEYKVIVTLDVPSGQDDGNDKDYDITVLLDLEDGHKAQNHTTTVEYKFFVEALVALPTCRDWHEKDASLPSGKYKIQPDDYPEPFEVYCDMDKDGGGWTLVEAMGLRSMPTQNTLQIKPKDEDKLLSNGDRGHGKGHSQNGWQSDRGIATIGQEKTNAIWRAHKFDSVFKDSWSRKHPAGPSGTGGWGCIDWFYQKTKYGTANSGSSPQNFDLWLAIRDTRLWGGYTRGDRVYNNGFWKGTYTNTCYDENTQYYDQKNNKIKRERFSYQKFWETRRPRNSNGGTSVTSRHGIPGDPNSGCVWAHCYSCGSNSYGNCGANGVAMRYIR